MRHHRDSRGHQIPVPRVAARDRRHRDRAPLHPQHQHQRPHERHVDGHLRLCVTTRLPSTKRPIIARRMQTDSRFNSFDTMCRAQKIGPMSCTHNCDRYRPEASPCSPSTSRRTFLFDQLPCQSGSSSGPDSKAQVEAAMMATSLSEFKCSATWEQTREGDHCGAQEKSGQTNLLSFARGTHLRHSGTEPCNKLSGSSDCCGASLRHGRVGFYLQDVDGNSLLTSQRSTATNLALGWVRKLA